MQETEFIYTPGTLGVSAFTGTGTEFNKIAAGLSKVFNKLNKEFAGTDREVLGLIYISATGSLTAKLANGSMPAISGARLNGEISAHHAGCQLLECVQQEAV